MELKLTSTMQFKETPNYYAIKKLKHNNKWYYDIIYGHFYNEKDMFIYEKVDLYKHHRMNEICDDYYRTYSMNLLTNDSGDYYLFGTFEEAKNLIEFQKKLDKTKL